MIESAELPLLRVLGAGGGRGVRRPAPRARGRPAARRPARRDHHRATAGPPASGWPTAAPIDADAVLVAVGVAPNAGLAEQAGLHDRQRHRGRRRRCAPSDPDIFAAGDVANAVPPVATAGTSGSSTGPTRSSSRRWRPPPCSARTPAYDELPYFFTDQYDLGMEYAGLRRARRLRPGGVPRRPGVAGSSSRSGSAAAGCWPA